MTPHTEELLRQIEAWLRLLVEESEREAADGWIEGESLVVMIAGSEFDEIQEWDLREPK